MGTRIIKQDDGKFGLFSTVSDRVWAIDCNEDEMVEIWKERAAEKAEHEMREWLADVQGKGKGQRRDNSMTLQESLEVHQFLSEDCVERNPEYQSEFDFDKLLKQKMIENV